MKTNTKHSRGSITVEAALVVPTVIMAVLIVIYIMMIIFQTCILQVTADNIAEIASKQSTSPNKSLSSKSVSKAQINGLGLYRRLGSSINQQELEAVAENMLRASTILDSKATQIEVTNRNSIIAQGITVKIDCKYNNPWGTMTAIWGLGEEIDISVWSRATVDDPVEFTRNCDFVIDTACKVPAISEFENKWQEIIDKINTYINKYTKGK